MSVEVMTEARYDTGELTLNYAEGPAAGPPLVLLHGGSARWQYFEPILPDLAARWHLFALDLRGHGRSERAAGQYTLRDYAKDIAAFLRQVSGPASLFGHSLGGMAALMTADLCPDHVTAVVVGDAPLDAASWKSSFTPAQCEQVRAWQALAGGAFSVQEIIAGLREAPVAVPGKTGRVLMREVYAEDNGVYAHLAERLFDNDPDMIGMLLDETDKVAAGYDLDRYGPRITCPVLLLQADPSLGGAMTDDDVRQALRLMPRARHRMLTGISHLLFHDNKAVVMEAVEAFLLGAQAGAP